VEKGEEISDALSDIIIARRMARAMPGVYKMTVALSLEFQFNANLQLWLACPIHSEPCLIS
jgi:hypothetical protein